MSASISDIDKNLRVAPVEETDGLCFYDVRKPPFAIFGLYDPQNEPAFKRLPDAVGRNVNTGVERLYLHTAGGRVRFRTDSARIVIRCTTHQVSCFPHMPMTGSAGFDLYVDDPTHRSSRFAGAFVPEVKMREGFCAEVHFPDERERYLTLHFPLYSGVKELHIGVEAGATLAEGAPYAEALPVVYYGSSITQGACASRPGIAFTNIVTDRMWLDHINLGFSGNGKGEDSIVDYMATLPMLAFVSDYDHNAPTVEHLAATHCRMYEKIRAAHPHIPYIMLSRPDAERNYEESIARRRVIENTYRTARERGDKNAYFIDGFSLFRGQESLATVEGTHPTDVGMLLMANAIEAELRRALAQQRSW